MKLYDCDNCDGIHEGVYSHDCKFTGDRVAEVVCPLDGLASFHYEWSSI